MTTPSFKGKKALVMAGGTGGHVFPALAVAQLLQEKSVEVQWLGTAAGIEARVIPQANIPLNCIEVRGLRGKGKLGLLKAPWLIAKAIYQAVKVIRKFKPDVVLGMGGFASGPGAVAARLYNIPLVIHEQNATAGMTNKLSLPLASRRLAAFPDAFGVGSDLKRNVEVVGNPVRDQILSMQSAVQRYTQRNGPLNILVVGGSLGAQAINEAVPNALKNIAPQERANIWHQTGERHFEATQAQYQSLSVDARVEAFIDDMDLAYAWADLIICRSGALTVSELAIAGIAAILVPFPYAVDDHQTANAKFLRDAGAAEVVAQSELNSEKVIALLQKYSNRELLLDMAQKAAQASFPEASRNVTDICLQEIK